MNLAGVQVELPQLMRMVEHCRATLTLSANNTLNGGYRAQLITSGRTYLAISPSPAKALEAIEEQLCFEIGLTTLPNPAVS